MAINSFDWNTYNTVMKSAGAGLKLALIEQQLEDIVRTARRFNNPLKGELNNMLDEVNDIRAKWKRQAELSTRQTPMAEPSVGEDTPVADANDLPAAIF